MQSSTHAPDVDALAGHTIRNLLSGGDPTGLVEECGPWQGVITELNDAHAVGGTPAVRAVWKTLSKADPNLITLQSSGDDGPLAGIGATLTEMIRAGCGGTPPSLPPIDHARRLDDLPDFVNRLMVVPKIKARDRKRCAAYVIQQLLLVQGRLILDTEEGEATGTPYIIGDDGAIWPLVGDLLPVRALLGKAGLNFSEPAFKWLIDELQKAAYIDGPRVQLAHFWTRRGAALYVSSGATRMVRAYLDRDENVRLELVPNGADDVYFASDAVLREWEPIPTPVSPSQVGAFCPVIVTPPEVPDYTPQIQRTLVEAWLVALVAGIRPLPILAAIGDKGGGKTHLIRAISQLTTLDDPNTVSDEARDLWTSSVRRPVLALDNVDSTPAPWLPDLLAAAVTGVNYERRKLYTDNITERRKVRATFAVSTRTAAFARPDVAERTLPIITGIFEDAKRASDEALITEVRAKRDAVLTWLAHHAVYLLTRLPNAPTLPGRFVDFGRIVWAHTPASAAHALRALQKAQAMTVGDADPLIAAILEHADALMDSRERWEGNASTLISELEKQGSALPYLGGGKAIARMLREGTGTLALFGLSLTDRPSGRNTVFVLQRQS